METKNNSTDRNIPSNQTLQKEKYDWNKKVKAMTNTTKFRSNLLFSLWAEKDTTSHLNIILHELNKKIDRNKISTAATLVFSITSTNSTPNTSFAEQDQKRKCQSTFLKLSRKSWRVVIKKKNLHRKSLPAWQTWPQQTLQSAWKLTIWTTRRKLQSSSHQAIKPLQTSKIKAISNIMGLSVFSWIPIGTKSQKVNGKVVHIPDNAKEVITIISAMTLYLKIEKPNNHFLLQKFKQELLPGMQDNRQELKRLFDLRGKEFSFHYFKLIHNMVRNYISKVIADKWILESSLPFETEVLSKLECSTFPYIRKEKNDNKQSKNKKKQNLKNTGSGEGPFDFIGNPREFFKITSRDSECSYNPKYPVDDYGKRICMNTMRYKRCTKPNCSFSCTEHMEKITKWIDRNNIQLRKRE